MVILQFIPVNENQLCNVARACYNRLPKSVQNGLASVYHESGEFYNGLWRSPEDHYELMSYVMIGALIAGTTYAALHGPETKKESSPNSSSLEVVVESETKVSR